MHSTANNSAFDIRSIDSVIIYSTEREELYHKLPNPCNHNFPVSSRKNNIRAVTIMSGISSIDKLFSCYHGKPHLQPGYTAGCFIPGKLPVVQTSLLSVS